MALFLAPPSGTPLDARAIAYRAPGSEEGYFLLILSPNVGEEKEEIGKNIVIVLDRSGSMAGRKIEQARGALRYVLSSLGPKDLFNVVAFNDNLRPFQPSLVKYNKDARDEALRFAESVTAEGGTNIHDAIRLALSQMPENGRPNVVIFLTDGIPTIGAVRETGAILKAVKAANERGARLFVFGVGHDVDAKFLDRLALQNRGIADYVAPEEDIETKVTSFYATIRHPVLTDLKLSIAGSAGSGKLDTYDLYPRELPDLFRGRPLVLAGRYRTLGGRACAAEVALEGKVGPEARRFVYPLRFESTPSNAFVGRLWATRRVGYLVDEIRLNGASEEVVREIVRLGTEFGIITEYTSFLIDEDRAFGVNAANVARAQEEAQRRAAASTGSYGFSQAANSKTWQRADQLGKENCWRDEKGREVRAEAIRNVGSKTFYWRGNRWIDGACQDERAVEGAVVVRLFSEEYFALARRAAEAGQWLSVGNEVTLVLEGKIYRVVENAEAR
jgi:Ca-activated chloride channel family protein